MAKRRAIRNRRNQKEWSVGPALTRCAPRCAATGQSLDKTSVTPGVGKAHAATQPGGSAHHTVREMASAVEQQSAPADGIQQPSDTQSAAAVKRAYSSGNGQSPVHDQPDEQAFACFDHGAYLIA